MRVMRDAIITEPGTQTPGQFPLRELLAHELAHWTVAQELGIHPEGFGLYGIEHQSGRIVVTTAGYVPIWTALQPTWEEATTYAAGVIGERLLLEPFVASKDLLRLFMEDPSCRHDLAQASCGHLQTNQYAAIRPRARGRLQLRTLVDYENLYGTRATLFKPGSRFDYSNYGFILLGLVIEKVSGQSYYDYVRDHVYAPAGMTSTGSEPEDQVVANRSVGYTAAGNGRQQPNTNTLPYRGTSAGGGYSTVGDLLRFANALQNHTLLDAAHTEMMTTAKVKTPGGSYDFGFGGSMINGVQCFGHNGGAPGMNGDLEICPSAGYVVAVLANMDPPAAGRISDFITNRLPTH